MSKADSAQRQESLQMALQVAKKTGDLRSQIDALDQLYSMASIEDLAAAIKIHGDLTKLEAEIETQGLEWTWKRIGASERAYSIAAQLMPSEDTDPNAAERYGQAKPFLETAIKEAALPGGVYLVEILYKAHMALSRYANISGAHDEYVVQILRAIQAYQLMAENLHSSARVDDIWASGRGMKWVLNEWKRMNDVSTKHAFLVLTAHVIGWEMESVRDFLLQCSSQNERLLREGSEQALEETQVLMFTYKPDTSRLRYWRSDEQGTLKLGLEGGCSFDTPPGIREAQSKLTGTRTPGGSSLVFCQAVRRGLSSLGCFRRMSRRQ
jgi:hypothetical protein